MIDSMANLLENSAIAIQNEVNVDLRNLRTLHPNSHPYQCVCLVYSEMIYVWYTAVNWILTNLFLFFFPSTDMLNVHTTVLFPVF